ncbi:4-oxalomesaconate tautomerase [Thalassospira sp.]|uniref:4-oxalomesaconate tautomerase n=1 Tax=Thalassospira sp. TaxID=1912094 RepID=UPI000C3854B7|nr:4-oxalomesaconate tautomerase [Thalassospira sp.]MAL40843.1 4-oxalomesaconate tautomerase [Thalassospira sp.]|tara:strand:- start:2507 stop:3625 length:1119 start_codon:yes stop_codon:yes gene_type:complete
MKNIVIVNDQQAVPCVIMRGGTSKGPIFLASDLPEDVVLRDRLLLAAMGSPDKRQIDGIGGADTLTSKSCIVSPSNRPDADVEFLFAQVAIDRAEVDVNPNCGNMTAAVAPFAIEAGLVPVTGDQTLVRIYNQNVGALVDVLVATPGGKVAYSGNAAIDGVPGTASPLILRFKDIMGSKTGRLLPTGKPINYIDGLEVTCIDVAVPMVMFRARDLGLKGNETKAQLDGNADLIARMEAVRRKASELMGLGDCTGKVVPKMAILSESTKGGDITSRYFVPHNCHATHAVTGAICVASCASLSGSIVDGMIELKAQPQQWIQIEHPSGVIAVELTIEGSGPNLSVISGGVIRTARRLFEGRVLVPENILTEVPG